MGVCTAPSTAVGGHVVVCVDDDLCEGKRFPPKLLLQTLSRCGPCATYDNFENKQRQPRGISNFTHRHTSVRLKNRHAPFDN